MIAVRSSNSPDVVLRCSLGQFRSLMDVIKSGERETTFDI
jgi:hypothetical protein